LMFSAKRAVYNGFVHGLAHLVRFTQVQ
jgi:hypothetical protein